MKRWAIIHTASGAIVALTSVSSFEHRDGLEVVSAPQGVSAGTHWWTGTAFAEREAAAISVAQGFASAEEAIVVDRPVGAWVSLSDGTMTDAAAVNVIAGLERNRFTLVGRFQGETSIEIVPSSPAEAIAAVRAERDRRLLASDKYALPDFPIDGDTRAEWLAYRAALRGLPEAQPNATLAIVNWPVMPAGGDA